jgi:TolB-like protein/Tfp pilus assembly protein PilF
VAYAIVGWLLVQIADTFFPALQLPEWTVTLVAGLVILGFPLALILSWAYELTPDGMERTQSVPLSESVSQVTGRKIDFAIIGALVLALGFVVVDNYVLVDSDQAESVREIAFTVEPAAETLAPVVVEGEREVLPNSVAVLLCDNLSPDPDDAYFAAGIHEEILNQLVKLSNLNVIARTSVLQYAEAPPPIPQIAEELNVGAVMECSVRYAGDAIVVTAQLIDPETNSHLWSNTYPGDLGDLSAIFAMQADIAMNIANALEIELSTDEQQRLARTPTDSPEAYQFFLAGRASATNDDHARALEQFTRAIEIDPRFARAQLVLSNSHTVIQNRARTPAEAEAHRVASLTAIERAIEIDPELPGAHDSLAFVHLAQGNWLQSEQEYRLALNLGERPGALGLLRLAAGQFEEATDGMERGLKLNPANAITLGFLIAAYDLLDQPEESQALYDRGEALYGNWFGDGIMQRVALGRRDVEFIRSHLPADPNLVVMIENLESPEIALEHLRVWIDSREPMNAIEARDAASWAAYLGNTELALEYLERGLSVGRMNTYTLWMLVFEETRAHPEFKQLLVNLGLPNYWREYGWPGFCSPVGDDDFNCSPNVRL